MTSSQRAEVISQNSTKIQEALARLTNCMTNLLKDLIDARRNRLPLEGARYTIATTEEAYALQEAFAAALDGRVGGMARHWKSGGPGRDKPVTHAPLPLDGVWVSPADARAWPFIQPHIEPEIALRLGRAVTPAQAAELSGDTMAPWVDAMTVSIEVVDSRWQRFREMPALHKLADLQVHGALVLAEWQPFRALDWTTQRLSVSIGAQTHHFTGGHGMNDPLWVLPGWLRHLTRHGDTVPAGTVVTTGSWSSVLQAHAGDVVRVAFDGVGEASVQL